MKTSKRTLILLGGATLTLATLSWERSSKTKNSNNEGSYSRVFDINNNGLPWTDDGNLNAYAADLGNEFYSGTTQRHPPAEDVLIQKIPGDNYHLLLMAVYSFENYSAPSVTIQSNGENLELRDDGQGFDISAKRKGIGFKNIQSRAELLNGKMNVISKPGEGCLLAVNFPVDHVNA